MASSSFSFPFISVALLLQLLLVSASSSTSTKYIDALCKLVEDKSFCIQTLKAYPPAVSASGKYQVANVVLRLSRSYAQTSARFIEKAAADKSPNLKKQLYSCQQEYEHIATNMWSAGSELKDTPETANYDAMVSYDSTTSVKALVGKNRDMTSKKVMNMTLRMEKLIAIAVGATELVGG